MATVDKKDEFITNYNDISVAMLGETSFQKVMLSNIAEVFNAADIGTEQKGVALTELAVQTAISYNKDAIQSALDVIRLAPDFDLKESQKALVDRQIQGYDDNLLIKVAEQQGGLASFAVNANSDSAQSTINDLKSKLLAIEERVLDLDGNASCPAITPVTPQPTGLIATSVTDTSISIEWNEVVGATLYKVYKDGLLVATSGSVLFNDTGLDELTKYSYAVKASIDGIESDYTSSLVVQTIATP